MSISLRTAAFCLLLTLPALASAQTEDAAVAAGSGASEELKIAALEALASAPPDKALPIVRRVLGGPGSDELKERALFVLSQMDRPEARALLVETAQTADGALRHEAIRMIGIGGDPEALAGLSELYAAGDGDVREAVLEAWLIAGDEEAVYRAAANATDPDDFEAAVETLGAMGATDQLRALRTRVDMSEVLIEAYAVAGDVESLRELAMDGGDPERQAQAVHGLGIAGGEGVGDVLAGIYRDTSSALVKEAVREGLMIAGEDEVVLRLFRESSDDREKRDLLETLVMMDSDAAWAAIDAALGEGQ